MRKRLTEKEAWELLEMFFGGCIGFCHAISRIEKLGHISSSTARAMESRFRGLPPNPEIPAYKFPIPVALPDIARMRFARQQAQSLGRDADSDGLNDG